MARTRSVLDRHYAERNVAISRNAGLISRNGGIISRNGGLISRNTGLVSRNGYGSNVDRKPADRLYCSGVQSRADFDVERR